MCKQVAFALTQASSICSDSSLESAQFGAPIPRNLNLNFKVHKVPCLTLQGQQTVGSCCASRFTEGPQKLFRLRRNLHLYSPQSAAAGTKTALQGLQCPAPATESALHQDSRAFLHDAYSSLGNGLDLDPVLCFQSFLHVERCQSNDLL